MMESDGELADSEVSQIVDPITGEFIDAATVAIADGENADDDDAEQLEHDSSSGSIGSETVKSGFASRGDYIRDSVVNSDLSHDDAEENGTGDDSQYKSAGEDAESIDEEITPEPVVEELPAKRRRKSRIRILPGGEVVAINDSDENPDEKESLDNVPVWKRRKTRADNHSDEEDMSEGDGDDEKAKNECKNCGKKYVKMVDLNSHVKACRKRLLPFKCSECNRSFPRKSQLMSHERTHTRVKPHECGCCGVSFAWSSQLAKHAEYHPNEKPFKCGTCGECFAKAATLVEHTKTHPKKPRYKCSVCDEMFAYQRELRKHQVVHALDDGGFVAAPSASDTTQSSDLLSQSLVQSGLKPFGCPICGKCFNRREHLMAHLRKHTGEKPHQCGVCGARFTRHNQLAFHASKHPEGSQVFKCMACEESFVEASELAKHTRSHPRKRVELEDMDLSKALSVEAEQSKKKTEKENEMYDPDSSSPEKSRKVKTFRCEMCGKNFARKLQLQSHQRTHTGEKPHPCGCCEKSFSWSNQLAQHAKKDHPGERAFKCILCGDRFSLANELVLHTRSHRRQHECQPCGLTFHKLRDFVKHSKMHGLADGVPRKRGRKKKEKSLTKDCMCDYCGARFMRKDNLKEHLRIHTGVKPFQCDICGKFFRLLGHLVKHKRTHTGEKPYQCESCYKAFTDSSKLARHVQMHTGSRPFICRTCGKYFTRKENLIEHAKQHHGEKRKRAPKVDLSCDECGRHFTGTGESSKCRGCRQITYECGICGDQFVESMHLLEHTKTHTGDWQYQYIPAEHELGQTFIQTSAGQYEFTSRTGGNLVIDVPAGATQEVIECILASSDIVMHTGDSEPNTDMLLQPVDTDHVQITGLDMLNEAVEVDDRAANAAEYHQEAVDVAPEHVDEAVDPVDMVPVAMMEEGDMEAEYVKAEYVKAEYVKAENNAVDEPHEEAAPVIDDHEDDPDFSPAFTGNSTADKSKPYECTLCEKRFRRPKWLQRHTKAIHGNVLGDTLADEAIEEFDEEALNAELDFDEEEKPKKTRKFKRTSKEKKDKNGPHDCKICGKSFSSVKWLVKHKNTPHKCDLCDKVFLRAKSLKEHLKLHEREKKFKCPACEESFIRLSQLIKHAALHNDGSFKCETCEKVYTKLDLLLRHTRLHNSDIAFTCQECGKSFPHKWALNQHTKRHTGEQPFQCETCGKTFSNVGNHKAHMRIHTGEKPFICETCGKTFREGGHLVKHRRTHTGEKPYVCKLCNSCFTDSSKLTRHTQTQHSALGKGHKCETCGKSFSRIDNLHTHEKTHTGEKQLRIKPATKRNLRLASEQTSYVYEIESQNVHHDLNVTGSSQEEVDNSVHTIEILRTPHEQADQTTDQRFLTLLVQRLNQQNDPHNQVQSMNTYNTTMPMQMQMQMPHPMPIQMQRPNVLNQFANVIDDYAMHYPTPFIPRK